MSVVPSLLQVPNFQFLVPSLFLKVLIVPGSRELPTLIILVTSCIIVLNFDSSSVSAWIQSQDSLCVNDKLSNMCY